MKKSPTCFDTWVKTAVMSKKMGDFFPISWPSLNVLTLHIICMYVVWHPISGVLKRYSIFARFLLIYILCHLLHNFKSHQFINVWTWMGVKLFFHIIWTKSTCCHIWRTLQVFLFWVLYSIDFGFCRMLGLLFVLCFSCLFPYIKAM